MAIAAVSQQEETAEADAPASARSRLYAFLSRSISFPEAALHAEVASGEWFAELNAICAGLPYRLDAGTPDRWRVPPDYDEFQSEYIRLFEVGARGSAPCPLNSGHHTRDRMRTMEELVRFYNFFGLKLASGMMPDHVTVELEFMHYLASSEDEDPASYLTAQRDFLQRQLLNWWPALAAKVKEQRSPRFYRALVTLGAQFLEAERKYLARAIEST